MRLVSLLPSGHVEDALCYLGCQADVLSLDPRSLDDVLDSILAIGDRAGVPDRAARLVADLRSRLARTAAGGQPVAARPGAPSVPTAWPPSPRRHRKSSSSHRAASTCRTRSARQSQ
jgi:iron complex transport system substrate-binding protein